jgi:hypothetical protein
MRFGDGGGRRFLRADQFKLISYAPNTNQR